MTLRMTLEGAVRWASIAAIVVTGCIFLAGVAAMGQSVDTCYTHSPGWQWGGDNCGCASNNGMGDICWDRQDCENCCNGAPVANPGFTGADILCCLDMCEQAVFPCQQQSFFQRLGCLFS